MLAVVSCYLNLKEKNDYLGFSQYFDVQIENEDKPIYSVLGRDPRGEAHLTQNYIVRTITKSYRAIAKRTFKKYKEFEKENMDIVETKMEGSNFIHKRYITTYPHEWTANMIKDAIIFDLELALKLRKYGLMLVDFTLRNNVFDFTKPIYVDFHGIVTDDMFSNGQYRFTNEKDDISEIWDVSSMQLTEILIGMKSFILLSHGNYNKARKMLMIPDEIPYVIKEKVSDVWELLKELDSNKQASEIYKSLIKKIKSVPVGIYRAANQYSVNYYIHKRENFDYEDRTNWKPKQNSIYEILKKYKPETVIDIGCNIGWFSILAERLGSKVVSVDADETVIDHLYLYSKEHKLNILPLRIAFEDLDKKYIHKLYPFINRKQSFESKEFYAAPILRLKSDMTLCLALVHHLVLAYGISIEKVMNILARITKKVLVLEIPSLQDNLIQGSLSYYRYAKNATSDQYSDDKFIKEGRKYFKKVTTYPSHPETRKIIVFEK